MRAGIRSRPWAGIDVGTFSVKLLLAHGGGRFALIEEPLPTVFGDAAANRPPEVIAKAVTSGLSRLETTPRGLRGVTMGIGGSDVIVKQIQLPLLDDNEVGPALRFEARKHLPFDPQTMVIDFQIVNRLPGQKRLDVVIAAVPREKLDRVIAPLLSLGIDADIVDATPLALTNALTQGENLESGAWVLLDIGHLSSHLTMFQRGEPYFSRRLDFGGRTLTQAIAEGTHVPVEEAEEWKLAAGSDSPGFRVDWDSREMRAVLESLRRDLAEELRRSFAFYRTLGQLPDPMRIWISGGSARLPGLSARLSELLGTPAILFDPIEKIQRHAGHEGGGTPGPQFAQAYGLALRSA
jgi:type IV pilus assembly protein PilM